MADAPTRDRPARILLFLIFFLIACVFSVNVFVYSKTKEFIFNAPTSLFASSTPASKIPKAEVAILLGASVYKNGELTETLSDRADTAIDLYKNGYVTKILVTGDSSTKYYNEVVPMKNYLLKHDVPEKDILTDKAGVDTFHSMSHAKSIFGVNSALVVSQRFHLSRAVYIARHLGIDAYGIAADHRSYSLKNDFRELFATVKSVWEVENY